MGGGNLCPLKIVGCLLIYKNKEWLNQKYNIELVDVGEIADICNVTESNIYHYLNKHKISLKYVENELKSRILYKVKQNHDIPNMQKYLKREYIDNFKSSYQIGDELNIDNSRVIYWLHAFKIPVREVGEKQRVNNSKNMKPTKQQWQIILASWLGDGSIRKSRKTPYLRLSHGIDQYDYLIYKKNILEENDLFTFTEYKRNRDEHNKPAYYLDGQVHLLLNDLYSNGYANSKACIHEQYLYQIDDYGLYIWYLDDGSLQNGSHIVLCTDGFTYDENIIIQKFLKEKFDISSKIQKVKKENHYNYRIRLVVGETVKFFNIIGKYHNEVPVLSYKFPEYSKEARQ